MAGSLRLASLTSTAVLYRSVVPDLSLPWRWTALPLTEANDEATAPFPVDTNIGRSSADAIGTAAPLTLYRLLLAGTDDAGNVLRVIKRPGAVEIRY